MEENLVGYLIDALDPQTRAQVKAQLEADSQTRSRLKLLRAALAPLRADARPPAPPPGLVLATLGRVAAHATQRNGTSGPLSPSPPLPVSESAGVRIGRFRRPDWLVAAVLLLLVGGLTATALVRQWRDSQKVACANNLRQLWHAFQGYADQNHGQFPRPDAPDGPRSVAGVFVPALRDSGFPIAETTLVCPAEGGPPPRLVSLSELQRLSQSDPERFRVVASNLAGCYAYSLGYAEDMRYHGPSRDLGDEMPLLADNPRSDGVAPPEGNSPNHNGVGQNVLYIGGHTRWCVERTVGVDGDDIYLNRHHQVRAGLGPNDTVLGGSSASPGVVIRGPRDPE